MAHCRNPLGSSVSVLFQISHPSSLVLLSSSLHHLSLRLKTMVSLRFLTTVAVSLCATVRAAPKKDCDPPEGARKVFDWTVTWDDFAPDGVSRKMLLVNDQSPGPVLEVNQGEIVEVNLHNASPQNTSLHFHGKSPATIESQKRGAHIDNSQVSSNTALHGPMVSPESPRNPSSPVESSSTSGLRPSTVRIGTTRIRGGRLRMVSTVQLSFTLRSRFSNRLSSYHQTRRRSRLWRKQRSTATHCLLPTSCTSLPRKNGTRRLKLVLSTRAMTRFYSMARAGSTVLTRNWWPSRFRLSSSCTSAPSTAL